MQNIMARFIKDESGATAIEYGLLAALIGVGIVAGASTLGDNLNNGLATVGNKVATESAKV